MVDESEVWTIQNDCWCSISLLLPAKNINIWQFWKNTRFNSKFYEEFEHFNAFTTITNTTGCYEVLLCHLSFILRAVYPLLSITRKSFSFSMILKMQFCHCCFCLPWGSGRWLHHHKTQIQVYIECFILAH